MTTPRERFTRLYRTAVGIRDGVRDSDPLRPWFTDSKIVVKKAPPILCFGFPRHETGRIPLVTIGINPSADEIREACVSDVDDPDVQFGQQADYFTRKPLDWFHRAQKIMQALSEDLPHDQRASYGGIFRGTRTTIHLDISPVVTVSINKPKKDAKKAKRPFTEPEELRILLKLGAHGILVPLLSELIEIHGVRAVVVLGTEAWNRLNKAGVSELSLPAHLQPGVQWSAIGSGPSDTFLSEEELIEKARREERTKRVVREALLNAIG